MESFVNKHTFVICAYKNSEYLEECIVSLKNQSIKSNILIITSTPNDYIKLLAEKYEIDYKINDGHGGIVQDWNFGYSQCRTPYVTIAHQDDIYLSEYGKRAVSFLEQSSKPLIYFSDYYEVRNGKKISGNNLLRVKRLLLLPLRIKSFRKSRFIRRRILSLGSSICCPSVTFAVNNLPEAVFTVNFRSCEDWEAWERISKRKGEFLYDPKILMGHRIHENSETSIIIGSNARKEEDFEMFCKFWPRWVAKILAKVYSYSENSNSLEK